MFRTYINFIHIIVMNLLLLLLLLCNVYLHEKNVTERIDLSKKSAFTSMKETTRNKQNK